MRTHTHPCMNTLITKIGFIHRNTKYNMFRIIQQKMGPNLNTPLVNLSFDLPFLCVEVSDVCRMYVVPSQGTPSSKWHCPYVMQRFPGWQSVDGPLGTGCDRRAIPLAPAQPGTLYRRNHTRCACPHIQTWWHCSSTALSPELLTECL